MVDDGWDMLAAPTASSRLPPCVGIKRRRHTIRVEPPCGAQTAADSQLDRMSGESPTLIFWTWQCAGHGVRLGMKPMPDKLPGR